MEGGLSGARGARAGVAGGAKQRGGAAYSHASRPPPSYPLFFLPLLPPLPSSFPLVFLFFLLFFLPFLPPSFLLQSFLNPCSPSCSARCKEEAPLSHSPRPHSPSPGPFFLSLSLSCSCASRSKEEALHAQPLLVLLPATLLQ
eukprot:1626474-Rhodomonas_salina.1